MSGFSPEQILGLRIACTIFCSISSLASIFLLLTYGLFSEKRRTHTGVHVLFQSITSLGMSASFMLALVVGDEMGEESSRLCNFQSWASVFFANCMVYSWVVVAFNMYFLVTSDDTAFKRQIRWQVSIPVILAVALISASLPLVPSWDAIEFDGVWCFIRRDSFWLSFLCFHVGMIVCALIGTFLWILILRRLRSYLKQDKAARSGLLTHAADVQAVQGSDDQNGDEKLKNNLLIRQTIYIGGFLTMLVVVIVENLIVLLQESISFPAWCVQGTAISLIGFYLFLVFGPSRRNYDLWRGLLCGQPNDFQS